MQVHIFDGHEDAMEFSGADPADFQPPVAGDADEQDKHCVVQIEPLQPGQTASKVSEPTCFDNLSDAIFVATGGAVRLPLSVEPGEVTEDMLDPPGPRSSTVIGIDYSGSSFSGSTLTWTTSNPNGCSDGTIYMQPSMPSGWANVVSSARSYQGCARYYHYDYANYGGSALECHHAALSIRLQLREITGRHAPAREIRRLVWTCSRSSGPVLPLGVVLRKRLQWFCSLHRLLYKWRQ